MPRILRWRSGYEDIADCRPNWSTAGLAPAERLAELERVAARYAVSLTPGDGRADRSRRSARSDRAPVRARCRRSSTRSPRSAPTRSATMPTARSKASCTAIPTACCSSSCTSARSIAASASAARWSGPGAGARSRRAALAAALDYMRAHPEIWEVILTGGDPLVLSPRRLREVMRALAAIEHVKIVRVHTRVPVVDPGAGHAGAGARAQGARQGDLCGAARQPSARADRARRARPARASSTPAFRC